MSDSSASYVHLSFYVYAWHATESRPSASVKVFE